MQHLLTPTILEAILGFPVENIQPRNNLVHYRECNRSMTHTNYSDLREKAEEWLVNYGLTTVMVGKSDMYDLFICSVKGDVIGDSLLVFVGETKIEAVLQAVEFLTLGKTHNV